VSFAGITALAAGASNGLSGLSTLTNDYARREGVDELLREPDDGSWQTRDPRRHCTCSKVMARVVFDRALRHAERFDLDAPCDRCRKPRDEPRGSLRAQLAASRALSFTRTVQQLFEIPPRPARHRNRRDLRIVSLDRRSGQHDRYA